MTLTYIQAGLNSRYVKKSNLDQETWGNFRKITNQSACFAYWRINSEYSTPNLRRFVINRIILKVQFGFQHGLSMEQSSLRFAEGIHEVQNGGLIFIDLSFHTKIRTEEQVLRVLEYVRLPTNIIEIEEQKFGQMKDVISYIRPVGISQDNRVVVITLFNGLLFNNFNISYISANFYFGHNIVLTTFCELINYFSFQSCLRA